MPNEPLSTRYHSDVPTLDARPRKTKADYAALSDDVRAELIQGEIYVSPAPQRPHQSVVRNLCTALVLHLRATGAGEVWPAPFDVHLPSGDVVQPDLVVVLEPNLHIVREWVYGAPDLVVEIVSPSHPMRDRIVKRALYVENGVREYWIVDPSERTVEVLALVDRHWQPAGYFVHDATLRSPLLAGFGLALGSLFAD